MAYVPDEAITRFGELTPTAGRIFLLDCKLANQDTGECFPSIQFVAQSLGLRLDHAKRYEQELINKRWIAVGADSDGRRIVRVLTGWTARAERRKKLSHERTEDSPKLGKDASQNLGADLPKLGENLPKLGEPYKEYNQPPTQPFEPAHEPVAAGVVRRSNPNSNSNQVSDAEEFQAESEARGTSKVVREGFQPESERLVSEEFLNQISDEPAYGHLDVRQVYAKMLVWCKQHRKNPTEDRLIGWLNSERVALKRYEKPAVVSSNVVPISQSRAAFSKSALNAIRDDATDGLLELGGRKR